MTFSDRAEAIRLRTYARPVGDRLETWEETINRVISHSRKLWEDAGGVPDETELEALRRLFLDRSVLPAGRTLWLGGTELAYDRPATQFNCSYTSVRTVYDAVDVFWLLLQGCGVGFQPVPGTLAGFSKNLKLTVIPSTRDSDYRGVEHNVEGYDPNTKIWRIQVGDSAEAWAKSLGKILVHKYEQATHLILDFSEIRGPGERLNGYGWICNGADPLIRAYTEIVDVLLRKRGQLLDEIDILDVVNHLGTVLSSRRSAQIALLPAGSERMHAFATAKEHCYVEGYKHRQQSNNGLVFLDDPEHDEISDTFKLMQEAGGSEPSTVNGKAAKRRAPWFAGLNPCGEILLADKGFCNLVDINLAAFRGRYSDLLDAARLIARHNYRQTCVNLQDGVLQPAWHQNNQSLRLCGVSLTGIVQSDLSSWEMKELRNHTVSAAYAMADELGLPKPKNVTTVKPSGTLSKIMDTTEGVHKPLGKYIFNWVNFNRRDEIVRLAREAGYRTLNHPSDPDGVLVCFPVEFENVRFEKGPDGKPVNLESAVTQLDRYFRLMRLWCDQNVSITVSYSPEEVPEIVKKVIDHWDEYVGVSWLYRADPTKSAKDLGYEYLPQDVVTEEEFRDYVSQLTPIDFSQLQGELVDFENDECEGGVCPVR